MEEYINKFMKWSDPTLTLLTKIVTVDEMNGGKANDYNSSRLIDQLKTNMDIFTKSIDENFSTLAFNTATNITDIIMKKPDEEWIIKKVGELIEKDLKPYIKSQTKMLVNTFEKDVENLHSKIEPFKSLLKRRCKLTDKVSSIVNV